jgi:chaperonin cofactor prefoldin
MAKTKTKKDKEVIDMTPKPEKINEQLLARLQASVKTVDQLTHEVGTIEVRKHALMKAMESVQTRIETLRVELKDQYGTDNISIQDGTINYQEENGEANKEN